MATNSKEYTIKYADNNREKLREYMRNYKRIKRAKARGFDIVIARYLYYKLIQVGVDAQDAEWCVFDATERGCFGFFGEK